ncbi:MAG: hypothetical protein PUI12_03525 [Bacteroidales bacterium]|nr:hypothetical protein [Bacteroidales bacterium]MDY5282294.1 hypothetical protein [Sodaliphilus sp.]
MKYVVNNKSAITYKGIVVLTTQEVVDAINYANNALLKLNEVTQEFDINIFETLGMRNLSGMVGEYFARSIMRLSNGRLQSNLHQDGYPDLLLTDTQEKKDYFKTLYTIENGKKYPISKEVFSPYKYGGIEIKATCGSTPPANLVPKPLVGEQRVALVNSFDWKAHHRTTNHLLAILWDFINGNPTIVACFFQDNLKIEDWGRIVQPHEGGGRTTSVSIMQKSGIKKMCEGWIAVLDNPQYIELLSNRKWIGYKVK